MRIWAVAALLVSCHGERDEAVRVEAGQVARAVEMLRAAPNQGKRPLLAALEHTKCAAEDVCALRRTCATAYGLQVEALDGIAAVRAAARDPSVAPPPEAAELLTRSAAVLGDAERLTKQCADLEAAARRRYSL